MAPSYLLQLGDGDAHADGDEEVLLGDGGRGLLQHRAHYVGLYGDEHDLRLLHHEDVIGSGCGSEPLLVRIHKFQFSAEFKNKTRKMTDNHC